MILRKAKSKGEALEFSDNIMEYDKSVHLIDEPDLEESLVKLESCIKKLKADQKICIEQFYLEKRCYQEIVEKTNIELKKVKSFIQNGKRNLKICLERN